METLQEALSDAKDRSPEFSVVITCYYEERSIDEFHGRLAAAMDSLGRSYEIVFVNDGSTDRTFEKLAHIFDKDPNVATVIDLFRNSGQLAAMTAGITHARGRHYIFMDSDLQLNPEDMPLLIDQFSKGVDIVSGYRKNRGDSILRRLPSKAANAIMRKVSGHDVKDFGCTFKIYNGDLIRAFQFGPFKTFLTAYVYSKAQRAVDVPIGHNPRKYGKSGWTFFKLFSFLMDNVVGVSQRPFQFLSLFSIVAAGVFFLRIVFSWVLPFSILPEITAGMILNVLLFHLLLTLAVLAAIGEYVIRNFASLQSYPIYIIRRIRQKPLARRKE